MEGDLCRECGGERERSEGRERREGGREKEGRAGKRDKGRGKRRLAITILDCFRRR